MVLVLLPREVRSFDQEDNNSNCDQNSTNEKSALKMPQVHRRVVLVDQKSRRNYKNRIVISQVFFQLKDFLLTFWREVLSKEFVHYSVILKSGQQRINCLLPKIVVSWQCDSTVNCCDSLIYDPERLFTRFLVKIKCKLVEDPVQSLQNVILFQDSVDQKVRDTLNRNIKLTSNNWYWFVFTVGR